MRKTNKILLTVLIVAVLLLGIGYAAVQNITLNITGTASADPSQTNFKVMFSGTPVVSDPTYVTTSITDETNATINVEGLTKKGDTATVTYTVQNTSVDLSSDLSVSTTNSNSEYFILTSELGKSSLVAGEATSLTITVELTKTPITESVSAVIGVQLEIMPVQPGEEGTSEGTNDFSQSPDYRNEYGFYFEKAYSAIIDGQKAAVIFHEDTSCELYMDGCIYQQFPAGIVTYSYLTIDASAAGFGIITVSADGKQINVDGEILEIEENFLETLQKGIYLTYNEDTENFEVCEEIPYETRENDIYFLGDYFYVFGSYASKEGWKVTLFNTDDISYLSGILDINLEGYGTDKNQTSYDPIPYRINGESIIMLSSTFAGCTELTTVPEIPYGVISIDEAFSGCTSLTTAPDIPNSVMSMYGTFYGCTSLTNVPNISYNVTDLGYTFADCTSLITTPEIPNNVYSLMNTFMGCTALQTVQNIPENVYTLDNTFKDCTSLTIVPEIPDGVGEMIETFSGCTALESAPEIPSSVWNMTGTFSGCTSLTGTITINVADDTTCSECFKDVDMSKITLTGDASDEMLDLLGSTGNNYTPIE